MAKTTTSKTAAPKAAPSAAPGTKDEAAGKKTKVTRIAYPGLVDADGEPQKLAAVPTDFDSSKTYSTRRPARSRRYSSSHSTCSRSSSRRTVSKRFGGSRCEPCRIARGRGGWETSEGNNDRIVAPFSLTAARRPSLSCQNRVGGAGGSTPLRARHDRCNPYHLQKSQNTTPRDTDPARR